MIKDHDSTPNQHQHKRQHCVSKELENYKIFEVFFDIFEQMKNTLVSLTPANCVVYFKRSSSMKYICGKFSIDVNTLNKHPVYGS